MLEIIKSREKESFDSSVVLLKLIVCNQDGKLLCNQILIIKKY